MAARIPKLSRPIVRRVGRLVVKLTPDGIELRGYRKKYGARFVTWAQMAALSQTDEPVLVECEERVGLAHLQAMQADPGQSIRSNPKPETAHDERPA